MLFYRLNKQLIIDIIKAVKNTKIDSINLFLKVNKWCVNQLLKEDMKNVKLLATI